MRKSLALIGLTVLVSSCERAVPVEREGQSVLSTVHFVTSLSAEDNEKLRERLGAFVMEQPAGAPPTLMVLSETTSPAFNFHVQRDCASATAYVEELVTRAAALEGLPVSRPDITCVDVGQL